jgi:hypothetical protein
MLETTTTTIYIFFIFIIVGLHEILEEKLKLRELYSYVLKEFKWWWKTIYKKKLYFLFII